MRGNGRLIRLGFAACRGDDFVGGVADFVDNHQIFRLCADADADVELVFHRVKFGVVAAPIDIKFGIVGAFFQQAGEYAAVIAPLRYGDADDAAYLVFFFGGRKQVFAVGKELLGARQEGCAKLGQVDIACVAGKKLFAEVLFQFGNHARYHLRRNGQAQCGFAELQGFGGGTEVF